ncbi:TPA: methionine adenosyltransferase [Candidatus Saccharibacteria bacterium]|nr:methionine adenosyltransferase [Candidatus Saccharibacteria bacterium]HIO87300.1 methionine adenosyltransferase [Candidatus Saccharibacteria bacterium]
MSTNYKSAESVSPKHPDKLCDRVSDKILDAYLRDDPNARVAVESAGGHGKLFVFGEVTSTADIDIEETARTIVGHSIEVETRIVAQSPEIAQGVDTGGAGDQGIMVGYASSETEELLPLEVVLSRQLNQYLYSQWEFDGKTQITLRDNSIESVVASFQNAASAELTDAVQTWLSTQQLAESDKKTTLHINPAGDWHMGGFDADTGLTGRKLVVDNYGPRIPIGGGCFSGKDPSKVDRSAAYMARKIARDTLKKQNAKEVFCYLAYAIGYDQPLEAIVIVDGKQKLVSGYDLSPNGIISSLDLRKPQYATTAEYGHFGHKDFAWEQ